MQHNIEVAKKRPISPENMDFLLVCLTFLQDFTFQLRDVFAYIKTLPRFKRINQST